MLNSLSLSQEGRRLCVEEGIFQQDNSAIHNASITKKYLLEQKIKLLDHPVCSPDFNPIENFGGLIIAKFYEGGWLYSEISALKNPIFHISDFHNWKIVNYIFFFIFDGSLIFLSSGVYIYICVCVWCIYIYIYIYQVNEDCEYPKNECSMYGYVIQNIPAEQNI